MTEQEIINYNRIAKAIEYIKANFKDQPNLDEVAKEINMSPFHFQRLFTEWAGTSPKKFLQYISVEYAKRLLKEHNQTIVDTAFKTGLSTTSRLHDLFIQIEGMTPAEYKNGGQNVQIQYSFAETKFGKIIVASTQKGICYLAFYDDQKNAEELLQQQFPNAQFIQQSNIMQQNAIAFFQQNWKELPKIKLHLKGTPFQLKVWQMLLTIPLGNLSTYGSIAQKIDNPNASRAVGSAIGSNPIAFIIPCHRVIQSNGNFGGYMWGNTRKTAIIGWENAQMNNNQE